MNRSDPTGLRMKPKSSETQDVVACIASIICLLASPTGILGAVGGVGVLSSCLQQYEEENIEVPTVEVYELGTWVTEGGDYRRPMSFDKGEWWFKLPGESVLLTGEEYPSVGCFQADCTLQFNVTP